jgi:two-component system, cell cycle sensor histidine kinase and response regulator CckA
MSEHRTILIVEDEPSIRVLLERVLARSGYGVVACATPAEALALDGVFNLAIVDFSLPGMDGVTLIGQLRRGRPDLPVILCSGLPMNPPVFSPPVHFLQKPYRLSQLAELVNTLEASGS